jgi:hypothetical protein
MLIMHLHNNDSYFISSTHCYFDGYNGINNIVYGNKQEEIYQPMQIKTSRLLSNGEIPEVVPPEKKLQIVSQTNQIHKKIENHSVELKEHSRCGFCKN